MFTTKKQKEEQQQRSRERRRFEVARTIYSTIINRLAKNATPFNVGSLPERAAEATVHFADALIAELEKKGGKQ